MNLTDEEIRIKIAEACGWTDISKYTQATDGMYGYEPRNGPHSKLPNYPESLDACAEFERTLVEYHGLYWFNLAEVVSGFKREEFDYSNEYFLADIACATARQRCLAYLKTKGLIP